jgi:AcrR family transcriptional regulator
MRKGGSGTRSRGRCAIAIDMNGDVEPSIPGVGSGFVDPAVPQELRERVLAAGLDELSRWGIERFSVGALAARHSIDESLIRQYWGDRQRLALDLLLSWDGSDNVAVDTGSLRGDLRALAATLAHYVNTVQGRSLLRALVLEDRVSYVDETRKLFWAKRFQTLRIVFDRAAERGELRDGVDLLAAVQLLTGPINVRALYTADPIEDQYCETVADLAWHAVKR